MLIIDAQMHLWDKGEPLEPHRAQPYRAEEALRDMNAADIARALVHPPSWDPDSVELACEAAAAHPDRFAVLGQFALDRPQSAAWLAAWKKRPGMLGLRFAFLKPHMRSWPTDGTIDWLWPAAERAGLPVALLASEFQPRVGEIAQRHPGLKLIVDHMGALRGRKGAAAFANLAGLTALARHPNVAVKATGGPGYASDDYPFASLREPYRAIYHAFGPRRMFWGTDITRMPCSWPNASPISPTSSPGSRSPTRSGSWARRSPTGSTGGRRLAPPSRCAQEPSSATRRPPHCRGPRSRSLQRALRRPAPRPLVLRPRAF